MLVHRELVVRSGPGAGSRPVLLRPVPPGPAPAAGTEPTPSNDRSGALPRPDLSDREVEVLLAWLRSESKEEAAQLLFISAATVSTHITRIRHKYAAVGRPANRKAVLLARALQDEFTSLDDW